MIKTKKSIKSSKGPEDGTRILITRYVPRYIKKKDQKNHWDKWLIDLSPSKALHKQYKNGKISWNVFSQRFRDEIINNERSMELCRQLAKESLNKNITLLCFEDDEHLCHRLLVRKICEQMKK
ncbi:MAG: DUF488 family protein [Nitrososphaeraceae archaeon]|nr:DUF488 family protein [Nitrososphaeraceae archaeon]